MDELERSRRTESIAAAQAVGMRGEQALWHGAGQGTVRHYGAVFALPVDINGMAQLQNLDAAAGPLGGFHYMVDFSRVDGPDLIP